MAKDNNINFEIKEEISLLSGPNEKGWSKELNLVSWNGHEAKYDIREWNEDHSKCSKGITLSYEELAILCVDVSDKGIC